MPSIAIRPITREDQPELLRLVQFAFQMRWSDGDERYWFDNEPLERWHGVFEGNRLAAAAKLHPMEMHLGGGRWVPMGGIGGVTCWPEYRRQGHVRELMVYLYGLMRQRRWPLSTLYPFAVSFYRRLGYELCATYKTYRIPMTHLPRGATSEVVPVEDERMEDVIAVYAQWAERWPGMLRRPTPEYWRERVIGRDKHRRLMLIRFGAEAEGYFLYEVKDRELKVYDWAALTPRARSVFWRFLGNHDSMADRAVINRVPPDDPACLELPEGRFEEALSPYLMARATHPKDLLRALPLNPLEDVQLDVHLEDPFVPENTGVYSLRRGTVEHTPAFAPDSDEAYVRCGPGELGALALGTPFRDLADAGRIFVNRIQDASPLLLARRPAYTQDFF